MKTSFARVASSTVVSGLLLVFCGGFNGCFGSSNPNGDSGGFPLSSTDTVEMSFTNVVIPHPGAQISGTWLADDAGASGSVTSFGPTITNNYGEAYVTNGRYYADWSSTVRWNTQCGDNQTETANFLDIEPTIGIGWTCVQTPGSTGSVESHFALQGSLPATFTAYSSNSSLANSAPTSLYIYNRNGSLVNTMSSTSIASSGGSATFPFPTSSGGSALAPDIYGLSLVQNASTVDGIGWVAVAGANTSYSQPFGVAGVGGQEKIATCIYVTIAGRQEENCTSGSTNYYYPAITLYGSNSVLVGSSQVQVGTDPTTIMAYDTQPYTTTTSNSSTTITTTKTGPSRALVVNSGSNSVSIIDLNHLSTLATINVGLSPIAATISPSQSTAYVANYGNGTISVIDLSTMQAASTWSVGGSPLSLALDNKGNLWVGENTSIAQILLSSGSVVHTVSMPGPVTSLAYSNGQSELLATVQTGGNIQANAYSYSNLISTSSSPSPFISNPAGTSAEYVTAASKLNNIPSSQALSNATLVSNDSQNSLTVSATSTGFVVTDLGLHEVIMQGNTPGPVRSIAVDPLNQVAYMTVPSQNLLITLPLPPVTLH